MASSKVIYNPPITTKSVFIKGNLSSKIVSVSRKVKVLGKSFSTKSIKASNFYDIKIVESKRSVKVSQKLPFYVKFENITIAAYGPSNPAPIGVQVIGGNNWIL